MLPKKLSKPDKQEVKNHLCNNGGIQRPWVRWWLEFRIYIQNKANSLSDAREFYDLESRKQLWSDPRSWTKNYDSESQDHASLRFSIAA